MNEIQVGGKEQIDELYEMYCSQESPPKDHMCIFLAKSDEIYRGGVRVDLLNKIFKKTSKYFPQWNEDRLNKIDHASYQVANGNMTMTEAIDYVFTYDELWIHGV